MFLVLVIVSLNEYYELIIVLYLLTVNLVIGHEWTIQLQTPGPLNNCPRQSFLFMTSMNTRFYIPIEKKFT